MRITVPAASSCPIPCPCAFILSSSAYICIRENALGKVLPRPATADSLAAAIAERGSRMSSTFMSFTLPIMSKRLCSKSSHAWVPPHKISRARIETLKCLGQWEFNTWFTSNSGLDCPPCRSSPLPLRRFITATVRFMPCVTHHKSCSRSIESARCCCSIRSDVTSSTLRTLRQDLYGLPNAFPCTRCSK